MAEVPYGTERIPDWREKPQGKRIHPQYQDSWLKPILQDLTPLNQDLQLSKDEDLGIETYPFAHLSEISPYLVDDQLKHNREDLKIDYTKKIQPIYNVPYDGKGNETLLVFAWAAKIKPEEKLFPLIYKLIPNTNHEPISDGMPFKTNLKVDNRLHALLNKQDPSLSFSATNLIARYKDSLKFGGELLSELTIKEKNYQDIIHLVCASQMQTLEIDNWNFSPHSSLDFSESENWLVSMKPIYMFTSTSGYTDIILSQDGNDMISIYNQLLELPDLGIEKFFRMESISHD